MSAIWGYISVLQDKEQLNKRKEKCIDLMKKPYEECAIDRFEETEFDNGFFSCGLQYFTDEAKGERLPIYDRQRGIVFAADILLNQRDELVEELKYKLSDREVSDFGKVIFEEAGFDADIAKWPDGALSYMAYILWKDKFTDHIQGLFAIAIYNLTEKKFYLYTDHAGTRCIYYSFCGDEIFFSSLIRPITSVMPESDFGVSSKWIAGSEYTETPVMILFPGITPFKNVYQVIRGNAIEGKVSEESITHRIIEYWNPAEDKPHRNKFEDIGNDRDAYFRKLFRETFFECVSDATRSSEKIAATISSGLDSTSVAAVAAGLLQKKNEKLYGFTSVPIKDYVSDLEECYIADESEGVKKFCEGYPNIEQTFLPCEGMSAFTEMDTLVHQFELPGKALINQVWMIEIARRMKEKGCNIMLNGQYGNFTISSGGGFSRTFQELYAGHFREAKKQLAAIGRRYGIPRKMLLSSFLGMILGKILFDLDLDADFNKSFDTRYLKKSLLKKYEVKETERSLYKKRGYAECEPRFKQDNLTCDETLLATMGIFDTKISLYYGVLFRDPTRDKRMIELCVSLPPMCFCDDGVERRLVREYLKDLLPSSIRNDPGHRGVQSADAVLRLNKFGTERKDIKLCEKLFEYLNEENVHALLKQNIDKENHRDIVRILALDAFLKDFDL